MKMMDMKTFKNKIIEELETRISYYNNLWSYKADLFAKDAMLVYESFLDFVKGLDEEGENDGD